MTRKMSQKTRGLVAEECLRRILEGWVPARFQGDWIREAPNAKSAGAPWRRERMTPVELAVLNDIHGGNA